MDNEQNNLEKQPQETQEINNNTNIEETVKNGYNSPIDGTFVKGNLGRPKGSKNKWTIFKERILDECETRNLKSVETKDMLKIAASITPREKEHDINQQVNITKVVWELDGKETEAPQKSRNRIHESEQV